MCLGLGLPGKRQLSGELVVWTTLADAAGLGLQHLPSRRGALGKARQRIGETFALALDVDHPNTIAWEVLCFSLSVPFATHIAEPRRRGLLAH
jgi:putative exporter of polyketide antibiotics